MLKTDGYKWMAYWWMKWHNVRKVHKEVEPIENWLKIFKQDAMVHLLMMHYAKGEKFPCRHKHNHYKCVRYFICVQLRYKNTITGKVASWTDMATSLILKILKESIKAWILCSLNLHFPLNTSLSFPPKLKQKFCLEYMCASFPIPCPYNHTEHTGAGCCHIKYLKFENQRDKTIFSYDFLSPLFFYVIRVTQCVQWSNPSELPTLVCSYNMAVRPRPAAPPDYPAVGNIWGHIHPQEMTCHSPHFQSSLADTLWREDPHPLLQH